ncbi:dihydrofolate reductase family protein [Candidatus Woesearchaeota archaeon]|nr:dihydrofolate reductase family protein [Candidatus Woesearchaeota archaeon]
MAMSVNGYIARTSGEEDFLSDKNWFIFSKIAKEIGCLIVGRKTYEVVSSWKGYNFDDIKAKKIIISKNNNFKVNKSYLIASSPTDSINKAKSLGFKKVLVSGGSRVNTSFIKEGLINEIILNVEPIILGNGIKLFAEGNFITKLKLLDIKKVSNNITQLHYKVKKLNSSK